MLSRNLRDLCQHLNQYAKGGVELKPEAVTTICAVLASCAEDARQLEACAVRPAEVVDLAAEKSRRDACAWLRRQVLKIPLHLISETTPEGAA